MLEKSDKSLLKIVKVDIVSMDFIGNIHANSYKQIDNAEIVAIVSRYDEKDRMVFKMILF